MLTSDFLNAVKDKQMLIISDSEEAGSIFQSFGFSNIANFNDFDFKNNTLPTFVVLTQYDSQSKMNKSLWDETGGIFVHLTASKFDPAPETKQTTLPLMQQFHSLSLQGNNRLSFANNRITQLILGGEDVTNELLTLEAVKELPKITFFAHKLLILCCRTLKI